MPETIGPVVISKAELETEKVELKAQELRLRSAIEWVMSLLESPETHEYGRAILDQDFSIFQKERELHYIEKDLIKVAVKITKIKKVIR